MGKEMGFKHWGAFAPPSAAPVVLVGVSRHGVWGFVADAARPWGALAVWARGTNTDMLVCAAFSVLWQRCC